MSDLLIVASDLHVNSTVALCPPSVNLDDGGTYNANPAQRWLWSCWLDAWGKLAEIAKRCSRVVLVLNGDLGELDTKRRSNQMVTPNKATVQAMIAEVLDPALKVAQDVYVIRGTQAHVGKSAWLEEAIAADIGAKPDKARGTASHWHLQGKLGALRIDIAHHASMGATPWARAYAAQALAARIMWAYRVERDVPAPQLVVRSHNHKYATSGDNYPAQVFYTPCWSLITEYGYRSGRENDSPDIGLLAFEIDNEKYGVYKMIYKPTSDKRVWNMSL